jgi:hypothetical protein
VSISKRELTAEEQAHFAALVANAALVKRK